MKPSRKFCGADTKVGTACRNWAAAGEVHCSDHGGASPRADARRAAKLAKLEAEAA
jgi:hypothetical protein